MLIEQYRTIRSSPIERTGLLGEGIVALTTAFGVKQAVGVAALSALALVGSEGVVAGSAEARLRAEEAQAVAQSLPRAEDLALSVIADDAVNRPGFPGAVQRKS